MSQVQDRSSHSGSSNEHNTSFPSQPFGESSTDENARLKSFANYPPPLNVNIFNLVQSGFIYSPLDYNGQPEVYCVGCKKVVEYWNVGDDPSSAQFHEPGCQFLRSSHHSGSGDESENLYRASVGNMDEHTKPLETTASLRSYEPHVPPLMPFGHHRKHGPPYRQAFSLPPERTEIEQTTLRTRDGDVSHIRVRSGGGPRSHTRRSVSPSPSSVSSFSSYHPAFLQPRSLDPSLSLPHSSIPESEHQDLQLLSRLENPPTLQEIIENMNMRDARHRLYTFERFWANDNVFTNYRLLVICGFYCLGQGDAVECFCCHIIIANWSRNDNPRERHIEMSPRCRFMKGEATGDIPLALEVRTPRPSSPNYSESTIHHHSPAHSHRSSHSHHSSPLQSLGPISQPSEGAGAAIPEAYGHPTQAMQERSNRMDQFPCSNPMNGSMREERARLRTFDNPEFRRHARHLRATNLELAQAGLYYTGNGDRTKCWFCDGGLENFEPGDNPWVEHAKYFPHCEHLLQQKGPEWVANISAQNPGIQRPIFPQQRRVLPQVVSSPTPLPYPDPTPPVTTQSQSSSSTSQPRSRIEDPQQLLQQRDQLLEQAMQSEAVQRARDMEFSDERIRQVQMQAIINTGNFHHNPDRLIQALLSRTGEPDSVTQPSQSGLVNRTIRLPGHTINIRSSRIGHISGSVNGQSFGNLPPPNNNQGVSGSNVTFQNGTMLINGRTMSEIMGEAFSHPFFNNGMEDDYNTSSTTTINIHGPTHGSPSPPSFPAQFTPSTATSAAAHGLPGIIGNPSFGPGRGRRLGTRSTGVVPPVPMPAPPARDPQPSTSSQTPPTSAPTASGQEPGTSNQTPSASNNTEENEPSSSNSTASGSTEKRLEAMEKERRCKICLTVEADILFQPCGHICACANCSNHLNVCPVCRRRIYRYTRVYHA